ncbi:hypothetical protein DAPPUDRAFT_103009 [Daphnia pulex]|uniref:Uncharacterized protein n=1 Tax=Daphnia pulex TaxID=6669 RepID=E9GI53_DAPPU|nr:hypothetical protein DAPPUDRAFT_103009 [Daphnia pulex]|eukprot:EFX80616.1 hypothetical protein DAPPUDRAFT_103009 [Daphnia pulex]
MAAGDDHTGLANLEDLITQLQFDDATNYSRRLGLGFLELSIRWLVGITTLIRCLTFIETPSQRIHASDIICELRQHLYRAKESFLDARSTRAIIAHVKILL